MLKKQQQSKNTKYKSNIKIMPPNLALTASNVFEDSDDLPAHLHSDDLPALLHPDDFPALLDRNEDSEPEFTALAATYDMNFLNWRRPRAPLIRVELSIAELRRVVDQISLANNN